MKIRVGPVGTALMLSYTWDFNGWTDSDRGPYVLQYYSKPFLNLTKH